MKKFLLTGFLIVTLTISIYHATSSTKEAEVVPPGPVGTSYTH